MARLPAEFWLVNPDFSRASRMQGSVCPNKNLLQEKWMVVVGMFFFECHFSSHISLGWTETCRACFAFLLETLRPKKENNLLTLIIIHQTHYEKSHWSRAFNQFTIACELDMINAISAAYIAFIMSSSTSAWLLSPLECSPQKQNGWTLGLCFWGWIMWKMYNKTIIEFGFRMISWIIKTSCLFGFGR